MSNYKAESSSLTFLPLATMHFHLRSSSKRDWDCF